MTKSSSRILRSQTHIICRIPCILGRWSGKIIKEQTLHIGCIPGQQVISISRSRQILLSVNIIGTSVAEGDDLALRSAHISVLFCFFSAKWTLHCDIVNISNTHHSLSVLAVILVFFSSGCLTIDAVPIALSVRHSVL